MLINCGSISNSSFLILFIIFFICDNSKPNFFNSSEEYEIEKQSSSLPLARVNLGVIVY